MSNLVEVGDLAQDQVTGFQGIVTLRSCFLYGCMRVALQPEKLEKGEVAKDAFFDEAQMIVITKQKIKGNNLKIDPSHSLGDEIKDKITGFKGILIHYTEYLFGDPRVEIIPKVLKDGKIPDGIFISDSRIDVVKKGKIQKPEVIETTKLNRPPGGPSREKHTEPKKESR